MPIDPETLWKVEWDNLPAEALQPVAALNIADFVEQRIAGKFGLISTQVTPPVQFQWLKPIFQAGLTALAPSPVAAVPALQIATAWQSSMLASQLIIAPGSALSPPPPGTNGIAAFALATIEPQSVASAFSDLQSALANAEPTAAPLSAVAPEALYKAFTSVTYLIVGLDTTPPPAGPIPISLTGVTAG